MLARAAENEQERTEWIDKIRDAALERESPCRLHAVETLAKLGCRLSGDETPLMEKAAGQDDAPLAVYAAWTLLNSAHPKAESRLAELLASPNVDVRLGSAYALRQVKSISPETRTELSAALRREPATSKARIFLVAAAAVHATADERTSLKADLSQCIAKNNGDERIEACRALAQIGDNSDLPMLVKLLDHSNADVRISAADAILRIDRRTPHRLAFLDWAVVGVYLLGMLSVGWYFWRRTQTREQYLLGDRKMRPLLVGISLFASLISTISYLAWPGEMIKYGPMMFCTLLAYPFVGLVVGWLIIPFIMRLKVISAYEILEVRLGSGVRTLGSLLFLSLRLLWMSVIVYAATNKVLIPLLGLDPRMTPVVCALLAFVTIVYTAMGGVRAVVITDVIQSAILLGAAIVTIVTITICLGGVQEWWPAQWPAHWPEPQFGYSSNARATLFGAMLATFT